MKKNINKFPDFPNENPPNYYIDHHVTVDIWRSLFESGNEELAHTTDEHVEIKQLHSACKVYQDLIEIIDSQ